MHRYGTPVFLKNVVISESGEDPVTKMNRWRRLGTTKALSGSPPGTASGPPPLSWWPSPLMGARYGILEDELIALAVEEMGEHPAIRALAARAGEERKRIRRAGWFS